MPKFTAYFTSTASIAVQIEADDANQAQEIADEYDEFPTLCSHCSGWGGSVGIDLSGVWEQEGEVEA